MEVKRSVARNRYLRKSPFSVIFLSREVLFSRKPCRLFPPTHSTFKLEGIRLLSVSTALGGHPEVSDLQQLENCSA